jgi:eukaryotic-like serine/threonine-protein kinase
VSMQDPADTPTSADPFVGLILADKYQIQASLGGGGAGQVYKAKHLFINRIVAIKVLFPHLAIREDKVQRFKQEALAMSHLDHPNITAVLDFGQADKGQPYLVMEYVQGTNLDD